MAQPVQAGGFTPDVYAEFTRPANTTAYAAGDNMATTTTAADVVPLRFPAARQRNGSGIITGGRMAKSQDSTTNASFRLWVFQGLPFALAGYPADNAAITFTYAALQKCCAVIDFTTFIDGGSAAFGEGLMSRAAAPFSKRAEAAGNASGDDKLQHPVYGLVTADMLLYGLLEARAAYTPASGEQFKIWLDVQAD